MGECGFDSPGSALGPMMDSWERGYKSSGYKKGKEFLTFTACYKILVLPIRQGVSVNL
jgi:hypothetical protein